MSTASLTARPRGTRPTVGQAPAPRPSVQSLLLLDQPSGDPPAPRGGHVVDVAVPLERWMTEWSRRYLQAAVDIVCGGHPVSQVARWSVPGVYSELTHRARLVASAAGPTGARPRVPQVRTVHVSFVTDAAAEVCAQVRYGARSRAIAARFEHRRGKWVCSALQFG